MTPAEAADLAQHIAGNRLLRAVYDRVGARLESLEKWALYVFPNDFQACRPINLYKLPYRHR
jgi:hypothetical protein